VQFPPGEVKQNVNQWPETSAMPVWKQLSIYTSESSRSGKRPLHTAIIATALDAGLYSASTFKSIEGFGSHVAIPTTNRMAMDFDLPLEIRIIDEPERIDAFLASYPDLFGTCTVIMSDIELLGTPKS
jgi:PII-like signaling protein